MDVHPTIGPKLRAWREIRGLALRGLEERTGIPFSQLSRYERGLETPTYARSLVLAKGLGVPVEDLWSHSPAPEVWRALRVRRAARGA